MGGGGDGEEMEGAAPGDSEVEEEKTGGAAGEERGKKLKREKKGWRDGPGRRGGGAPSVSLRERQQAALHHVSPHADVFFYTLNDDAHQSRADSRITPAANMQRPAVRNLLTPPAAAYRRNQSAARPPPRIYLSPTPSSPAGSE